jgi:hypothetical protein
MNMDKTEKKLKQLFSELKAQDSQRVPPFNSVTRMTVQSTSTRTLLHWPRFAPAGAAVAVLIGGSTVRLGSADRRASKRFRNALV